MCLSFPPFRWRREPSLWRADFYLKHTCDACHRNVASQQWASGRGGQRWGLSHLDDKPLALLCLAFLAALGTLLLWRCCCLHLGRVGRLKRSYLPTAALDRRRRMRWLRRWPEETQPGPESTDRKGCQGEGFAMFVCFLFDFSPACVPVCAYVLLWVHNYVRVHAWIRACVQRSEVNPTCCFPGAVLV